MPLESATYTSDLNVSNPVGGTDLVSSLDDHIRLIKQVLQNTFPNINGAVNGTPAELNRVVGVTGPIQTQLDAKAPLASPTFTGTPAAPTAAAGTSTTQVATTAFVQTASFSAALPNQTGNAGKFVTTDGSAASWAAVQAPLVSGTNIKTVNSTILLGSGDVAVQPTLVSGTNIKTINGSSVLGSGDLTVSAGAGDHSITVITGNGFGSTNTVIRRFTTTLSSTGTAITYADSATLGSSFTINAAGLYEIYYQDRSSAIGARIGISVNSTQLTTSIDSISTANRLGVIFSSGSGQFSVTRVVSLAVNDVIRPHTDGTQDVNQSNAQMFSIRKVGNV